MTRPGIETRSLGPLANTLPVRPIKKKTIFILKLINVPRESLIKGRDIYLEMKRKEDDKEKKKRKKILSKPMT